MAKHQVEIDGEVCRRDFENMASRFGISIDRFEKYPDRYKYEYTVAMYELWREAFSSGMRQQLGKSEVQP